jgi:hypothetical protein
VKGIAILILGLLLAYPARRVEDASVYPQNYFKSPLDIPLTLAGNFGEPRKLHFHTGLDFKTNSEEGHKVFAAADGYISRINVSAVGYGNALYITHANGYVTVYGHLKEFIPAITARLRKEQYAKELFAVDFNLQPGEIPVKQGDLIALSGNTGGSGGPHLHFEIRDASERAINPLLFGIPIKDNMRPQINYLKFYPMDDLKYRSDGYRVKVAMKDGEGDVPGGIVKLNCATLGISVNTFDLINESESHIGVYSISLFNDELPVFTYQSDQMTFRENRYVISQLDYPIFINEMHKEFHKCFTEPGNKAPFYSNVINRGVLDIADNKIHNIKIEVRDYAGNLSTVKFKLVHDGSAANIKAKELTYLQRFDYDKENEFSNFDISLKIPKGALLDTVYFNYSSSLATDATIYSKVHQLDKFSTQVFDWYTLSIKPEKLTPYLCNKAVIVFKDENGSEISRGGKYNDGFITTRTREFGTYYIRLDTVPPHIVPVNISTVKSMKRQGKIVFKITDNLSGIDGFKTYMDDHWVVTDYDAKSSSITHTIDKNTKPGVHTFKVSVTDERKNESSYIVRFTI